MSGASPPKALPPLPPTEPAERLNSNLSDKSSRSSTSLRRKPVPGVQQPPIPSFNFNEHEHAVNGRDSRQSDSSFAFSLDGHSRTPSRETPDIGKYRDSGSSIPVTRDIPIGKLQINDGSYRSRYSHAAEMGNADISEELESVYSPQQPGQLGHPPQNPTPPPMVYPPRSDSAPVPDRTSPHSSIDNTGRSPYEYGHDGPLQVPRTTIARPSSAYTLGSELNMRNQTLSPRLSVAGSPVNGSPNSFARPGANNRRSPDMRPTSYVDLLNLPYNQQIAPAANMSNAQLRTAVGQNASLLDTKKTLDMYRANVKKTQDTAVQYEFALFMVQVAREFMAEEQPPSDDNFAPPEMLKEARQILQKLADRSYPFAQYYLADGYASGLFNKDKPDYDRAFPLFIAASKHGHAESGYRAALCYEFGWGCRKDYAKAVQFFRAAASKNHPGAATRLGKACLTGDMGLQGKYREGVKWLKRASESADYQYNNAPYELGLLHETGYGDDIFKDEVYAVQLFTQAAELGHPLAALKLGEAYEHALLRCPKDAALSVHYYNCAAQADIPDAMMNLCAWYMVGAEPVLDKDENEAYEWAKKAAEHGECRI